MKIRSWMAVAAIAVVGVAAYGAYSLGMTRGMQMAPAAPSAAAAASEKSGRRVLYWHDPMVPGARFDKPGKSPFMDMELVPVYADEAADAGAVRIDPSLQQNLGMRTAVVERARLDTPLEVVASVAYDERDVVLVQARANGYVERLFVRAPLDPVRRGQPLAQLYVPEWIAAQEEYLAVRRLGPAAPEGLLEGARQRLRLAGMEDAQVEAVEKAGAVQPRLTIVAPASGVVGELAAREGMTVANGAPLFRINGLSRVWVNAEVPESAARDVTVGARATVRVRAFPQEAFEGRVSALLPEVSAATRTLKARVEVANRGMRLVPGMFARVAFGERRAGESLVVPSEAVIRTGKRDVVMVALAEGRFAPVAVEVGREAGGRTEIRSGLHEGERVVLSGQFLIDSEASLRGIEQRTPAPPRDATPAPVADPGHGAHAGGHAEAAK